MLYFSKMCYLFASWMYGNGNSISRRQFRTSLAIKGRSDFSRISAVDEFFQMLLKERLSFPRILAVNWIFSID